MRVVLQRVSRAEVRVGGAVSGRIGAGFLVLVAFTAGDDIDQVRWMADKIGGLRVFADDEGKMNRSLGEAAGEILIVSQFTLYADVSRGRRPSFVAAARPEVARPLYEAFVAALGDGTGRAVETGEFGAMMDVESVNAGPVTLVIDAP